MAPQMDYQAQMDVITSWDKIKLVKDYERKAGDMITNRFFELEPQAKLLFHLDSEEPVFGSPATEISGKHLVEMIDVAVDMLDPDMEPVIDDVRALGQRHKKMGIQPRHLFAMEKAVVYCLEELLEDDFKKKDRRAWGEIFQFLIKLMQEGMENKALAKKSCYF